MQDPYADIEWKQATCILLWASRQVYGDQNTYRRTGTRLKRHHCAIPYPTLSFGTSELPSLSLCRTVKGSGSNARPADRLCHCKRRMETGSPANMPIYWLMVRGVIMPFCRFDFTICLSSRALVMGGCWDPAYHSVWLSAAHWFHIRYNRASVVFRH